MSEAQSGDISPPEDVPPVSAEVLGAPDEPPRRYPSTIGGMLFLAVLATVVTGVLVVVLHDWRTGVRVIGGALAFGALARLLVPEPDAGMLAVRHRVLDVAILAGSAALLIWLAGSIPNQPL